MIKEFKDISLNHENSCFYIKKSNICDGYGVFAKKDIPKNVIITYYYGYLKSKKLFKKEENKYAMEYDNEKGKILIGFNDIEKLELKGVAQLVNDAISPNITGKTNNAFFEKDEKYIFLKTINNISKDEEILAPYGINYWKYEIERNSIEYNIEFIIKIKQLYFIISIIEKKFKCDIMDCFKFTKKLIKFRLLHNKRYCLNINNYHNDENFYIYIVKEFKKNIKKTNYYYTCNTCFVSDMVLYTEYHKIYH